MSFYPRPSSSLAEMTKSVTQFENFDDYVSSKLASGIGHQMQRDESSSQVQV